jgi:V/A-type H+-transporting ATPase subunit I
MFQSQTMSRVELVIPEKDVIPVTEALAASGIFQPARGGRFSGARSSGDETETEWQEWAGTFAELEHRILDVMAALEVEEGAPPESPPHLIDPEVARRDVRHLEEEAQIYVEQLKEEQGHLADLQQYLRQLRPIADLDVDLRTLQNLAYVFILPGTMPLDNLERFRTSLEHVPFVLVTLDQDRYLATVALFGAERDSEILERAARSAYLKPIHIPTQYQGTPREVLDSIEVGVQRTRERIADLKSKIHQLHEMRIRHLRYLLWRVRASRSLVEAIANYDHLRYTYLVNGWVPADKVEALRSEVGEVSEKTLLEFNTPNRQDKDQVPIALSNPGPLRAFQGLVTNYGHPSYGELDPTFLLALTFPLVFGIMFGDVGHGVLLILVGMLLASRKIRSLRSVSDLGMVLVACGAAATVFGFLYGSIFGFEQVLTPLWKRPLEEITDVLLVTVGVGVILLSLGMISNMVNAALAKNWTHLVLGHQGLAGLIFYWSMLGLIASVAMPNFPVSSTLLIILLTTASFLLVFGELLFSWLTGEEFSSEDNMGTYLMQAFFELFELVIGLFSNTLSYVRMGAFAVAHGALSLVIFILAEMVGPAHGFGYWVVIILGNLFVLGFEGMIVGIQTLRLEYYEFFSKFFTGGGMSFSPLTLIPERD